MIYTLSCIISLTEPFIYPSTVLFTYWFIYMSFNLLCILIFTQPSICTDSSIHLPTHWFIPWHLSHVRITYCFSSHTPTHPSIQLWIPTFTQRSFHSLINHMACNPPTRPIIHTSAHARILHHPIWSKVRRRLCDQPALVVQMSKTPGLNFLKCCFRDNVLLQNVRSFCHL